MLYNVEKNEKFLAYGLNCGGDAPHNLKKISYSSQLPADEPIDIIYSREE